MGWIVLLVLVALLALPLDTSAAEPIVIQEGSPGRPRVVVSVDPRTDQRSIQLTGQGTPTYPTVDMTCDGQRRAIALTRSELVGNRILAIYGVPANTAKFMLDAVECRMLLPAYEISLPARQLRAAWRAVPKSIEAPKATPTPAPVAQADRPTASARPGVHPEDAWRCPSAQPIKGNFTTSSGESCIYHMPGGQFYGKTKPELCYATEADAQQDGCRKSRR